MAIVIKFLKSSEAVMQRARSFFYVAAGIFLLALSYHLGARSARAQAGATVECASTEVVNGCLGAWAVINRYEYVMADAPPAVSISTARHRFPGRPRRSPADRIS